jgi:hypothetical protein
MHVLERLMSESCAYTCMHIHACKAICICVYPAQNREGVPPKSFAMPFGRFDVLKTVEFSPNGIANAFVDHLLDFGPGKHKRILLYVYI